MKYDYLFSYRGQLKDGFPVNPIIDNEKDKWLEFIEKKGILKQYIPRLKNKPFKRDEALAEITSAYFLEKKLGYPVTDWHVSTSFGKNIDFIILYKNKKVYCEVNSPSWLKDIENDKRTIRKKKPKYINAEVITFDTVKDIREAIKNKYKKFLLNEINLLILKPDKHVGFLEWPGCLIDKALFEDKWGYFKTKNYENLSALLILEYKIISDKIEYQHKFYTNRNAKKPFPE